MLKTDARGSLGPFETRSYASDGNETSRSAGIEANGMILLVALHLTGGALAVVSGLVALYATKGAALHRRSGTIFAYAMLSLSLTGAAAMAAGGRTSSANVLAGLLTTYLVTTALTTVRARSARVQILDRAAMVAAVAFGGVGGAALFRFRDRWRCARDRGRGLACQRMGRRPSERPSRRCVALARSQQLDGLCLSM